MNVFIRAHINCLAHQYKILSPDTKRYQALPILKRVSAAISRETSVLEDLKRHEAQPHAPRITEEDPAHPPRGEDLGYIPSSSFCENGRREDMSLKATKKLDER